MGRKQEPNQHLEARDQLRGCETRFDRPVLTWLDRRRDYGEDRYLSIGLVEEAALIVVSHTRRDGRIRLVSARPASRKERRIYHERLR